jgi:signal transduction histidine kinase/ActR/RegA family two-component response regulator
MLKQSLQEFANKNLQFVLVGKDGKILESEPAFLPIKTGDLITDVHPFFEGIAALEDEDESEFSFYCVHLEVDNQTYITDIQMFRKKEGLLIVIQDLTEHYETYQAVAQARNESIINEELIVLKNAELEERERFKNLFIQNFSHELRNPLMSSMAITQILGDTDLNTEQKQLLDVLRDSNSHLKLLLEDTLSISMIASGKLELKSSLFNLSKLLELLSFTYQTKARAKGLRFTFKADKRVPEMVEGDRLRLFQVLTNLLDNAIKYTHTGSVELRIAFNQQWANKVHLNFAVKDTGPGIPENKRALVFETFSQLASPNAQQGTGLGLALVKGLLSLMESEIKLESTPGTGTVFSFDLGLKVPLRSTLQSAAQHKSDATSRKIGGPGRKYKLLLVEDDERVLTVLFKILMDTKQFYIDVLADGAEVLEAVIQNEYDLILMDINLPNTRGDQLTQIIREFPFKNVKQLPIVGITAYAYEDHMKAYKDAGMNAVLAKPFDSEELLTTLFSFLRK